jgi:hypothetical protein
VKLSGNKMASEERTVVVRAKVSNDTEPQNKTNTGTTVNTKARGIKDKTASKSTSKAVGKSSSSLQAKRQDKKSEGEKSIATVSGSMKEKSSAGSVKEDAKLIDDLFSKAIKKKRQHEEAAKEAHEEEEVREKRYKEAALEAKRSVDIASGNPDPQVHRWDKESGLPVYKYYHLRMGEAGSGYTPLCPFDCSCCF